MSLTNASILPESKMAGPESKKIPILSNVRQKLFLDQQKRDIIYKNKIILPNYIQNLKNFIYILGIVSIILGFVTLWLDITEGTTVEKVSGFLDIGIKFLNIVLTIYIWKRINHYLAKISPQLETNN